MIVLKVERKNGEIYNPVIKRLIDSLSCEQFKENSLKRCTHVIFTLRKDTKSYNFNDFKLLNFVCCEDLRKALRITFKTEEGGVIAGVAGFDKEKLAKTNILEEMFCRCQYIEAINKSKMTDYDKRTLIRESWERSFDVSVMDAMAKFMDLKLYGTYLNSTID